MINKVFLQKENGEFVSPCTFDAFKLFKWLGYETEFFEEKDLESLNLSKHTLVVGWVRVYLNALKILGVTIPEPIDYPDELESYFDRKIFLSTMGWVREQIHKKSNPFFVKPYEQKSFLAFEAQGRDCLLFYGHVPDSEKVWISDIKEFESEYRCFIHRGKLIGMKHYLGNFKIFPNISDIENMISLYQHSPLAYGLDVGIVKGKTILVEVNDSFALGNYGWYTTNYCSMLESRWLELTKELYKDGRN
jgi:ATP-grasp domain, R2K clade family 2